ncbi:MAG: D-aminoacylase [Kiritimatiellae bacterium]|nr:D-aminoacylase [Kiritimatiellia bacterium]
MTLVKNALVVDGSGKDAFPGHIVIDGEKIAEVGEGDSPANEEAFACVIDAGGKIASPGFVDCHSHSDAYLVVEPDAPSKVSQGVTTEINGQCGGSVAPRYGEARLSSDWASILGERLTWRSMAEYRAILEKTPPAINTIQFVGHNTLRSSVVGYQGRIATEEELSRMARLLEESLDAGAWGLTTGLIYQPGKYSTPEEVEFLAKTAAAKGGFYATHMRSEGDNILEAIDEVISLVRATGIRAEISHLKTSGQRNWHKIDAVLEKMQGAVDAGLLLGSDRYPFCAAGTDLDVVFPDWAGEGAAKAECERLADPAVRQRIADEMDASSRDWSQVMVGGTWNTSNKRFSGRMMDEICAAEGVSPGEMTCRILEKDKCRTGGFFFGMSEENLDKIYSMPWILPGSDASLRAPWGPLGEDHPHPRAYGTMPEFFRRLRRLGFSREEAVRRMTSAAAERFGIRGRGLLKRGCYADIAIWDEATFANTATYTSPHSFAHGVKAVFVNGSMPYREGSFTHERAGRFLSP